MLFADVLLRVTPGADDELERLSVAADLAQRLKARLNGVFVAADIDKEANWAKALFERAVGKTSLETTWRVIDGHSSAALLFQARRSDLSILPPAALVRRSERQGPESIALECGGPTLVLPQPKDPVSIGHKVLVGWNDTHEAARAMHDAMPILVGAESVCVLTVVADEDLEPLGDRRLADHLKLHGVSMELARRHGDPAEEIASKAREMDADLLVIGLRRASNGSASPLGDVSSRFARTMSLPVLFSH
jgi:nucleotide-binding universal stress UspA family protein